MARAGGNRLRTRDEARANRVPNEPGTMINLLRGVPGVFGSVHNDQVRDMSPAILYVDGDRYACYYDAKGAPLTRPLAHLALADDAKVPRDSFIRAYVVGSPDGITLFPKEGDLTEKGIPRDEPIDKKFKLLIAEFAGRAAVEFGGVSSEGKSSDLATIALGAQKLLADAHDRNLDFMQTELDLRAVIDAVLA